jgi:hypothetical protein
VSSIVTRHPSIEKFERNGQLFVFRFPFSFSSFLRGGGWGKGDEEVKRRGARIITLVIWERRGEEKRRGMGGVTDYDYCM